MDISAYENADIIFDLNNPNLTNELKNRFDYILDGGTTEHVFDYPQALRNIVKMLKVGGKVFHMSRLLVGRITAIIRYRRHFLQIFINLMDFAWKIWILFLEKNFLSRINL